MSSISIPDAIIDLDLFKKLDKALLGAKWFSKYADKAGNEKTRANSANLTFQDILYDNNIVDGFSFLKAFDFNFEQVVEYKRKVGDTTESCGKKWEYKFKWEGDELVLDNTALNVSKSTSQGCRESVPDGLQRKVGSRHELDRENRGFGNLPSSSEHEAGM